MTPRIRGGKPLQKRKALAGRQGASHETNNAMSGYHTAEANQGEMIESFNSIVAMLVHRFDARRALQ